jgi:NAD(P)-dependent dehydrogenase (short-subunit alcohol dehydrogenase family)
MSKLNFDYNDQTVIITGGTSGIGREVAQRFGKAGANVINADVTENPKDASVPTHEAIRSEGGIAEYVETDVTNYEEINSVIEAADEFGGVDIMVNNAGLQIPEEFLEATPDQLQAVLATNAGGVFFGTQTAAKDMIKRSDPGVILNTASISSNLAQFDQVQYDASKGAVRMITRGAALELAEHGIRVNAVAPGQIATEFTDGWSEEAKQAVQSDELLKPVPLGRAGIPEDVAGIYLFLASDEAKYITGEMVHVDGGWQIF